MAMLMTNPKIMDGQRVKVISAGFDKGTGVKQKLIGRVGYVSDVCDAFGDFKIVFIDHKANEIVDEVKGLLWQSHEVEVC